MKTQKNTLLIIHKASKWGFVFSIMLVIFVMSHQDANDSSVLSGGIVAFFTNALNITNVDLFHWFIRKLAHAVIYALLGFFTLNALSHEKIKPNHILLALAISILYAISDEIHQTFIPGRSGNVTDVLIDTLGASLGLLTLTIIKPLIKD